MSTVTIGYKITKEAQVKSIIETGLCDGPSRYVDFFLPNCTRTERVVLMSFVHVLGLHIIMLDTVLDERLSEPSVQEIAELVWGDLSNKQRDLAKRFMYAHLPRREELTDSGFVLPL